MQTHVLGVQYALLESNVTLACRKSQIRTPVFWHHNNSAVLPWHKVTSDGTLVLLHVDLSAQGNYSCYDNGGLLLHSVKLRLGLSHYGTLALPKLRFHSGRLKA
ncbi:Ciliary neurotrophic factor receptor subunit alpha [Dissostichus eleginoides]|uniref:Ciliary neurotrophic factor receptor subunit alpha n=1 Tax=Dissostichus eleginoides TaxID=100907 RepID=A0AAD9BK24_DISEL|nr:Ciliary neurotrophic factor receptor subunit alpha [Dissostichus eleginoides]